MGVLAVMRRFLFLQRRLGRVQRQIYRCLIALGRPVKIRDLLKWCYPHAVEFQPWHRTNINRAISRVARPVEKPGKRFARPGSCDLSEVAR